MTTTTTVDPATAARIRRLVDALPAAREKRQEITAKWDEKIARARAAGRESTARGLEFVWDDVKDRRGYCRCDWIRATLARLVYLATGTEPPNFSKVDVLEVPAVVLRVDDRLVIVATDNEGAIVTIVNVADIPTL
jgi:hypothetical protein